VKRDALQRLIAPLAVDNFVTQYWMQRSVHIAGGVDKVAGVFSLDAFRAAVAAAAQRPDAARQGFEVRAGAMRAIPAATIDAELAAGNTICVSAIELGDRTLAALAAELKNQLAFPGRVSVHAYLSPKGSGFSFVHFDARIATTLQIAGRKRWRYAQQSSLPWPAHNVRIAPDGSLDWHMPPSPWEQQAGLPGMLDLTEVVLEPGHVLCLPPGTFHAAEAVDELSLSININFNYGGFFDLLLPYLRDRLAYSPAWREPPPAVAPEQAVPARIAEFTHARIAELRRALDALEGWSKLELASIWHQSLHAPDPRVPSSLVRALERTDTLHVVNASFFTESSERGFIATGRGLVEINGAALFPFAREVVTHRSFVAEEALAWSEPPYKWDALKQVLAVLVQRGVLVAA